MSTSLADLFQHPERVTELPEHELPGLLLQVAGLLTALSSRTGVLVQRTSGPEAPNEDDHLLTVPQVADILRVPKGYAYELVRRGSIPAIRFGKYVRVPRPAFREWVVQHQENELDGAMYTMYGRATPKKRHDRRGTPTNPKATRADSSEPRGTARRHIDNRRPVGAE